MNCPKCHEGMETIIVQGIEIDRCIKCRGIWFDMNEKEHLKRAKGAYKADIGHQAIGEYYNEVKDVNCPKCSIKMKSHVEKRSVRIEYETCPKCEGAFFDAGEFREFAEPTILEFTVEMFEWLKKCFRRRL